MAVASTNLATTGSSTDATSYSTASVSPGANRLVLITVFSIVGSGTANIPNISGNGLTWEMVRTRTSTVRRVTTFRAMGASPSSGAISIDFRGQTQTGCLWSVADFSGIDTSGINGAGAIVQAADNSATATSLTVTLAAFQDAANATYGTFYHAASQATTAGSGFSNIGSVNLGSPNMALNSEFKNSNDTGVDSSWATSSVSIGIAIEIRDASAAAIAAPSPTIVQSAEYSTNSSPASSGTVTLDSTPTPGNYLVCFQSFWDGPGAVTPTGFTQIDADNANADLGFRTSYRLVQSGDGVSWTMPFSDTDYFSAIIVEVANTAGVDGTAHSSQDGTGSTNLSQVSASVTPSDTDGLVLSFFASNIGIIGNSGIMLSPPVGYSTIRTAPADYNCCAAAYKLAESGTAAFTVTYNTNTPAETGHSIVVMKEASAPAANNSSAFFGF